MNFNMILSTSLPQLQVEEAAIRPAVVQYCTFGEPSSIYFKVLANHEIDMTFLFDRQVN